MTRHVRLVEGEIKGDKVTDYAWALVEIEKEML
jgi:hypothetical protein